MLRAIVPTTAVMLSTRLNVFGWNRHRHDVLTAQEHLLNATRSLFQFWNAPHKRRRRRAIAIGLYPFNVSRPAHRIRLLDVGENQIHKLIKRFNVRLSGTPHTTRVSCHYIHAHTSLTCVTNHAQRPVARILCRRQRVHDAHPRREPRVLRLEFFRPRLGLRLRRERRGIPHDHGAPVHRTGRRAVDPESTHRQQLFTLSHSIQSADFGTRRTRARVRCQRARRVKVWRIKVSPRRYALARRRRRRLVVLARHGCR
mmetsp:Transcript_7333/g.26745  ORF Transcript_7333/g.26745 Transcript_7333/m.26745 type:complete len:256 (+) Transcript_7333:1264-2031(+)